jgi:predicted metal-dependent hydrolase
MTRQTTTEEPGFANQLDLFAPLQAPQVVARPDHLRPVALPRIRQPEIHTANAALPDAQENTCGASAKKAAGRKKGGAQRPGKVRAAFAVPGGAALCQRMFTRIGCAGPPPAFRVEFYPYSSLTLTVRRRDEEMIVRFSDLLQRAPMNVLEGAAALLLAKIYRRRMPRALAAPYNDYAKSHRTRQRIQNMRSGRVRRAALDATGRHFDMNAMFDDLNARFFANELRRPHLGWSTRGWRRQFGSYDPGPDQILLNKRMDRPEVPRYVVEYVLYHEMLHVKHPTRKSGCTLLSHSPEFRAEEKLFPEFHCARKALDRLAR